MLQKLLLFVCLAAVAVGSVASAAERPLTIFAAASLQKCLNESALEWQAAGHPKVAISYAASSTLAKQIEQGAPADVYVAADNQWMDYLQDKKLVEPASRFVLVRNTLVLVAPATSTLQSFDPARRGALLAALGNGRLAVAETSTVAAGIHAKQTLQKLGIWNQVASHLAQGENERAALESVVRGDALLAIVYLTDAKSEPRVKVLATFAARAHEPIVYPAARTTIAADSRLAAAFLEFLRSKKVEKIFRNEGFVDGR